MIPSLKFIDNNHDHKLYCNNTFPENDHCVSVVCNLSVVCINFYQMHNLRNYWTDGCADQNLSNYRYQHWDDLIYPKLTAVNVTYLNL